MAIKTTANNSHDNDQQINQISTDSPSPATSQSIETSNITQTVPKPMYSLIPTTQTRLTPQPTLPQWPLANTGPYFMPMDPFRTRPQWPPQHPMATHTSVGNYCWHSVNCRHPCGQPAPQQQQPSHYYHNCCHNRNTTAGIAASIVGKTIGVIASIDEITDSTDDSSSQSADATELTASEDLLQEQQQALQSVNAAIDATKKTALRRCRQLAVSFVTQWEDLLINCYGLYVREETDRFVGIPKMIDKLAPIKDQLKTSFKALDELKTRLDNWSPSSVDEVMSVMKALPEFPDLLAFYKSVLDDIPFPFLMKCIQTKSNQTLDVNDGNRLPIMATTTTTDQSLLNTSQQQPMDTPTKTQTTPTLRKPKPISFEQSLTTKPLTDTKVSSVVISTLPSVTTQSIPTLDKPKTIPVVNQPPVVTVPVTAATVPKLRRPKTTAQTGGQQSVLTTSSVPPGFQTTDQCVNKAFNSMAVSGDTATVMATKVDDKASVDEVVSTSSPIQDSLLPPKPSQTSMYGKCRVFPKELIIDTFRMPYGPPLYNGRKVKIQVPAATPAAAAVLPKPVKPQVLNKSQSKLLAKLKLKYGQLSDETLVDSMLKTKAELIRTGNHPQGFTGMKVVEIVDKISSYIDRNANTKCEAPAAVDNDNVDTNETIVCFICLEPIQELVRFETQCRHLFHKHCIDSWLHEWPNCPLCQSVL